MNTHLRRIGLTATLFGMVALSLAAGQPRDGFLPESRVWVEGTSSVRGFTCEAAEVKGTLQASTLDLAHLEGAVQAAEIVVDAAALDCGNGTMNSHMRNALKATEHGAISFRLTDYHVISGADTQVRMNGALEIAGQQRPITVTAIATAAANGAIRVQGTHTIKMTDYGVKPPSLMMGTMKVHDPVELNFDVVLEP